MTVAQLYLFRTLQRTLPVRKATLASVLAKAGPGIRFNEHIEGDGPTVFAHACKMGFEGIVSKRKDSTYRSGRSPDWLKMKNADAPAVRREADAPALKAPLSISRGWLKRKPATTTDANGYWRWPPFDSRGGVLVGVTDSAWPLHAWPQQRTAVTPLKRSQPSA